MFISILVTTFVYVLCLITVFITGHMNTVMSFISIALISYSAELVYRLLMAKKIISKEKSKKIHEDVITYS